METEATTETEPTIDKEPTDTPDEIPFEFRGKGMEFFKIWIVNLFLSIITLGVYSAWAKVRTNKYFYNHFYLDGHNFDYHANPLNILIGRIIAVGVFLILTGVSQVFPLWGGGIFSLVILISLPWIVVASLSFRNRNSSYKGIRFNFRGSYGGAFLYFLLLPLLGVLSFGILMPLSMRHMRQYIVSNSSYGTTPFEFDVSIGDYYIAILKLIGLGILLGIGAGVLGMLTAIAQALAVVGAIAAIGVYLFIFAFYIATIENLQWNGTSLGNNYFDSDLDTKELMILFFTNSLMLIFTLGLALPVVKVRLAAYRASRLALIATDGLDHFIAAEQEQVNAAGQEVGEIFDFDLGF
jgi:uncharacterized membrane protein YjgN (DUF898 family)